MVRITKSPEERRGEIIDVAMRLFGEQGYDATSVSDVVKTLGVAQGTFYYHFKSKSDVVDAAIERVTAGLGDRVDAIVDEAEASDEDRHEVHLLRGIGTVLMTALRENHELVAFLTKPGNEPLHERVHAKLLERLVPALTRVMALGVRSGRFDVPHPDEAVDIVVGLMTQVARRLGTITDHDRIRRLHESAFTAVLRFLSIT